MRIGGEDDEKIRGGRLNILIVVLITHPWGHAASPAQPSPAEMLTNHSHTVKSSNDTNIRPGEHSSHPATLMYLLHVMSGLTCVVLHHVLVVSVGRLAEVHAHVGVAARPPRQQTEARARVHHLRTEYRITRRALSNTRWSLVTTVHWAERKLLRPGWAGLGWAWPGCGVTHHIQPQPSPGRPRHSRGWERDQSPEQITAEPQICEAAAGGGCGGCGRRDASLITAV